MSEIKVNKLTPRTNCGTVQLGDSGDTITIPAGASITNSGTASGFGATGSASWTTTVKTGDFTAVVGEGYFINTTSGAVSVTLPAGTAGAVVAIKDYAGTFDTNKVTLIQNGSDKIGGSTINGTLDVEGIAVTLVFIDSTQGWLVTDSGLQSEVPTAQYIVATGGTIVTSGDFKYHTFTGPGSLCVSNAGNASGSNKLQYLVVAGGGSGAGQNGNACGRHGAGGGAGGYRCSETGLCAAVQAYPITVGGGGAGNSYPANNGSNSIFSTITSTGGGRGGGGDATPKAGGPGGSGGGTGRGMPTSCVGAGNTPPVSPSQGNPGSAATPPAANPQANGAGGGAGAAATPVNGAVAAPGGAGKNTLAAWATATSTGDNGYYAGGGGGGSHGTPGSPGYFGVGGAGGGGNGGAADGDDPGCAGSTNTGGGGGGAATVGGSSNNAGGAGGSGIVIIKYKFQN